MLLRFTTGTLSTRLGKFMSVVVTGLLIHGTILLPLVYLLWVRRNPWAVIRGVSPALLTVAVQHYRSLFDAVRRTTTSTAESQVPTGTSVNVNGTALYKIVTAVFIVQLRHINLDLRQIVTIVVTSAILRTGAVGIPVTGAVTTVLILTAVDLPVKEAAILVAVEWLLESCNTGVNVVGDCINMALVDQLYRAELGEMEEHDGV